MIYTRSFDKNFASQQEFDAFGERLLDFGTQYYFEQNDSNIEYNGYSVDDFKISIQNMVDAFVWSYNDFEDKLIVHANEVAAEIMNDKLHAFFQSELQKTTTKILTKIPENIESDEMRTLAIRYFSAHRPEIANMYAYPNAFAACLKFTNAYEQSIIAHLINTEY